MMYDGRDMLEKPLMRAVSEKIDISCLVDTDSVTAEFAPALGNDGAGTCPPDSFKKDTAHHFWVFNDDAAKANVYRRGTIFKKFGQIPWRSVIWWFPEKEATNI